MAAEKTYESVPNPRITVSNLVGKVIVKGWDRNEVHAVYTVASPRVEVDAEQMPASGQAEKIHFTTRAVDPRAVGQNTDADYTLEVPVGSNLDINDPEGSISIEGLRGDVWVESVGAPVSAADISGHLAVRSVGGNIEVTRASGRVELVSINGDLRVLSPATTALRGETTKGQILYEGNFLPSGNYVLSSYSGDVNVVCPPSDSLEVRAQTVRGKLDNELKLSRSKKHHAPLYGNSLMGFSNTGMATVELNSYSGNIHISPQK